MVIRSRAVLVAAIILGGCGGGGGSHPSPTPTPTPTPQPSTFSVTGTVTEPSPFTGNVIAGARVEFVDGANAGKSATTDASGHYSISNVAQGGFTLRASADGYQTRDAGIGVTTNLTQDFQLPPDGPRRKFGPGQYRVGRDVAPGRYYSDPNDGCYWEREKGLSGSLNDIIANEFVGYDAGQWIVDIAPSDMAFKTDEDCGTWSTSPRSAPSSGITPGLWLVPSQVKVGTYSAATRSGCYWARLKDFSGTLNGIIDNDFVSGGGSQFVTIKNGDKGFQSDDDCGDWTRTAAVTGTGDHSIEAIARNRERRQDHLAGRSPLPLRP